MTVLDLMDFERCSAVAVSVVNSSFSGISALIVVPPCVFDVTARIMESDYPDTGSIDFRTTCELGTIERGYEASVHNEVQIASKGKISLVCSKGNTFGSEGI